MRTGKDWIILRACVGVQSSELLWRTEHVTVQTGRRSSWNESEVRLSKASTEAGRGHGVLCSQPLSVRNQQIGPDPERPAWVHEMEPERIHSSVYLVSESALSAGESCTSAGKKRICHDETRTSVRPRSTRNTHAHAWASSLPT